MVYVLFITTKRPTPSMLIYEPPSNVITLMENDTHLLISWSHGHGPLVPHSLGNFVNAQESSHFTAPNCYFITSSHKKCALSGGLMVNFFTI